MDEREFQLHADEALAGLDQALGDATDQYDFEPDFQAGALSVEFDDPPAKFVFSPNSPVRQIWISAHSTSYKLDWNANREGFVLESTGQGLRELTAELIRKQLGEKVTL